MSVLFAFDSDEYRAVKTASYTYVKTSDGPAMLFNDKQDHYQLNNLVNHKEFAEIQAKLDNELMQELSRIGETEIRPREYYLKKFGYYGKKEFRKDFHIANVEDVKVVITPNETTTF